MTQDLWIVVAVLGGLAFDGLMIWPWRRKRLRRLQVPAGSSDERIDPRLLRSVVILVAGALLLALGQAVEPPFRGSGDKTSLMSSLLGVGFFVIGGALLGRSQRPGRVFVEKTMAVTGGRSQQNTEGMPTMATSMKNAQEHRPSGAARLELAATLIGSGMLLLVGHALRPILPQAESYWAAVFSGLGLALFVLTALGFASRGVPRPIATLLETVGRWLDVTPAQVVFLLLAPLMSLAARLAASDGVLMRQPTLAVASWLTAISLVVIGCAIQLPQPPRRLRFGAEALGVAGLFLVAFLLRGIATSHAPWLFTGDEGSAGLTAVEFITGFRDNLFALGWASLPSLFFYVQSPFIRVLGQTVEALRISSALAGALTIVATYFFARETFGRRVAWASAIYLAAFHFHIHFSRIALNFVWDGLFMAIFSAVFWRGWLRNQRGAFVAAGFALGLSQYFYVSVRVLLPLIALWLLAAYVKNRSDVRTRLPGLVTMSLATLVVALPLALLFVRHPQEFQAPIRRVAALGPWIEAESEITGKSAGEVVWGQFKSAGLGFTSVNLRLFYAPGEPMLLALPATLFLMGLTLLLLRIRQLTHIYLGLWILAAVFVGGLSLSPPASQRYVFAAPAVAVLVAIPLITAIEWLSSIWPGRRILFSGLAALTLAVAIWNDVRFYFGQYTPSKVFGDVNTETAQRVAELIAQKEDGVKVYFLGGRIGFRTHSSIPYLAPQASGQDVLETLAGPPDWPISGHTIFILLPERANELAFIQEAYPGGDTFRLEGKNGPLFVGYEVGNP